MLFGINLALTSVFFWGGGLGIKGSFRYSSTASFLFLKIKVILNYTVLQDDIFKPLVPGLTWACDSFSLLLKHFFYTAPVWACSSRDPWVPSADIQPIGTGEISSTEIVNHITRSLPGFCTTCVSCKIFKNKKSTCPPTPSCLLCFI